MDGLCLLSPADGVAGVFGRRIPLMLVEGEEAPTEMKLITVDNGLVRECGCRVLPLAQCSALTP